MPNHDMSDIACRERAETAARLDDIDECIKELYTRLDTMLMLLLSTNPDLVAMMPKDVKAVYDKAKGE